MNTTIVPITPIMVHARSADRPHATNRVHPSELVRRQQKKAALVYALTDALSRVVLSIDAAREVRQRRGSDSSLSFLERLTSDVDSARPDLSELADLVHTLDRLDGNPEAVEA